MKEHIQKPEKIQEGMESIHAETDLAQWKRDLKNAKQALVKSEAGLEKLMRRFVATDNEVLADAITKTADSIRADRPALQAKVTELEGLIKSVNAFQKIDSRFWRGHVPQIVERLEHFGFDDKALTLRAVEAQVWAAGRRVVVTGDMGTIFSDSGRNTRKLPFRCDNKRAA